MGRIYPSHLSAYCTMTPHSGLLWTIRIHRGYQMLDGQVHVGETKSHFLLTSLQVALYIHAVDSTILVYSQGDDRSTKEATER